MFRVTVKEKEKQDVVREFDKAEVTLGRGKTNDLVLAGEGISKRQARIVYNFAKHSFTLYDLRSTNGTAVNGETIEAPHTLKPRDKITIEDFTIEVVLLDKPIEEITRTGVAKMSATPGKGGGKREVSSANLKDQLDDFKKAAKKRDSGFKEESVVGAKPWNETAPTTNLAAIREAAIAASKTGELKKPTLEEMDEWDEAEPPWEEDSGGASGASAGDGFDEDFGEPVDSAAVSAAAPAATAPLDDFDDDFGEPVAPEEAAPAPTDDFDEPAPATPAPADDQPGDDWDDEEPAPAPEPDAEEEPAAAAEATPADDDELDDFDAEPVAVAAVAAPAPAPNAEPKLSPEAAAARKAARDRAEARRAKRDKGDLPAPSATERRAKLDEDRDRAADRRRGRRDEPLDDFDEFDEAPEPRPGSPAPEVEADAGGSGIRKMPKPDAEGSGIRKMPKPDAEGSGIRKMPKPDAEGSGIRKRPKADAEGSGIRKRPKPDAEGSGIRKRPKPDAEGSGIRTRPRPDAEGSGIRKMPRATPDPDVIPDAAGSGIRRMPTPDPLAASSVSPATRRALVECLQRYIKLDEKYRRRAFGKPCRCGSCLLCESKRALAAR